MTERDWDGAQKEPGFALGKRVWFASDFDGARYAAQFGHDGGKVTRTTFATALGDCVRLKFADGTDADVPVARLRLTEPKPPKARTPKARPRKEAIAPEKGEELSIFDALAEG